MTTPQALEEYLGAHGIDGAPTKPGCFAVLWRTPFGVQHVSLVEAAEHCGHLCMWVGGRSEETMKDADCIIRHAPLHLAPPGGHALGAAAGDSQTLTPR